MVFFANSNDIIVVDIEVTEKIDDRYLKSFVLSNLKLKNISLENCDKLYVNYLEYPKEYQVFVVNSQFIFFDFEAFYSYYENRDFEGFELLIYSNFFLIFKDKKFFYYQKINQDLNQDDFIKFLNKKFNINISNIKLVSKDDIAKHYGGQPLTAVQVVVGTTVGGLVVIPLWLKLGLAWVLAT